MCFLRYYFMYLNQLKWYVIFILGKRQTFILFFRWCFLKEESYLLDPISKPCHTMQTRCPWQVNYPKSPVLLCPILLISYSFSYTFSCIFCTFCDLKNIYHLFYYINLFSNEPGDCTGAGGGGIKIIQVKPSFFSVLLLLFNFSFTLTFFVSSSSVDLGFKTNDLLNFDRFY